MKQSAQPRETAHVRYPVNDDSVACEGSAPKTELEPSRPEIDFRHWSVEELRALACQLQIPGASSKNRQELIEFFETA
jgi:hypothetical protein